MDCSMPGLLVPHHLPEFAQVPVHCFSDAPFMDHSLVRANVLAQLSEAESCCAGPPKMNESYQSSDKTRSTGGENSKPPQYTCHENLMNYMKDQNDNLCLMWYLKVNQDHYWCLPGKHWYVKTRCIRYVFQAETCRRVSTFCSGILAVLPASLLSDIPSSVSASAVRSMGLWLQLIETHPLSCLSFSHFIMNFSYLKQNQKPFCNFTFPTPLN